MSDANRGWQDAHEAVVRISRRRAGLDFEEGVALLAAARANVHREQGLGSFVEYVARWFGYSPRLTHEKLRVAEALERLPELAASLRDGVTSWSCVRELTRVVTPETQQIWLEHIQARTAREVEKMVSGRHLGDVPSDPSHLMAVRRVLRFEVSAEVLASFREATAKLQRDAGGGLDDDALLLQLSRLVLAGPTDDGRASYQIAVNVCAECGRATQEGAGEPVPISEEAFAMACCDAQFLGRSQHVEREVSAGAKIDVNADSEVDAEPPSATHVGSVSATHVGSVSATHVGSVSKTRSSAGKRARATQCIPPAVRRAVLRRDHHRCQVPGCIHAHFVDVHHIEPRAASGGHDVENLITLCGAHHRALHHGKLRIVGRPGAELRFLHADGRPYGTLAAPEANQHTLATPEVDLSERVVRALHRLGLREPDARQAAALAARIPRADGHREAPRSKPSSVARSPCSAATPSRKPAEPGEPDHERRQPALTA